MRYRHDIQALLAVLVAGAIGTASAALQQHTFDRYQTILDRQPFGEIRPDRSAPGPAVPPPPPFTKDIKMCAITEDETGVQVGFVNAAVKPPKSYFLRIGETEDDITLVHADYELETAILRKGEEERTISMAGTVPAGRPASQIASASPSTANNKAAAARKNSYTARLKRRREKVRVRNVKPPKLEGDALKKHLEEYQMDLIRKGMPPLPLQLTEEMDAQLVAEGVLPPAAAEAVVPAE